MENRERLTEAGVPEDLKFQTKPEMALEMIQEATAAGIPGMCGTVRVRRAGTECARR